jgi:dihydrofolate reductase
MGTVYFDMSVSLDGYVAGPGDDLSWHRVDDELMEHFFERERTNGAHIYGRRLYESMLYWQDHDAAPADSGPAHEYGPIWREMPKYVAARALLRPADNTSLIEGDLGAAVAAIKEKTPGSISVGGPTLAASLTRLGLVDEITRYVVPVVIGDGIPFFPKEIGHLELELVEARTFASGVVMERYRVPR